MLGMLHCIVFVVGTGPVSEDHECYLVDMCAVLAYVNVDEKCASICR